MSTATPPARRAHPSETPEEARDVLAKLIDQHLTMPLRSRSTMTVAEHYKILRSIRDFARSGGSMT